MKARKDFVSNSSSSSFICTCDDLDNIAVYGSKTTLSLAEYCKHYALDDVFGKWRWFDGIVVHEVKFVSDKTLQDNFSCSIYYELPVSAKNIFAKYIGFLDNSKGLPRDKYVQQRNELESQLASKIYEALAPKWKNTKFVCIDASDDCGDEQLMEDEFCRSSLVFRRVFNNH